MYSVIPSLLVWLCTAVVVYSVNAAGCDEGKWDKLIRLIFILAGIAVIRLISGVEAMLKNFSFTPLLARLTGFTWGYYITDLFWSRTDKYNFDVREEMDG